jgi:antitoxin (DNA-binding transcriptional repressor) of toxin-antitoxin stability system
MKTIAAAKFKETCLALLDRLEPDGIVVTKHGKPVAIVRPVGREAASLIGSLRQKVTVKADLLSTGVRWDARD